MASSFTLDSAGLDMLFQAWSIPRPASGLILFGLRGCLPAAPAKGWVRSMELEPARIDHVHMRCTMGIWDPRGKRLFAAAASTVPLKENVEKAAEKGGLGTNQIEPGYYLDLTKGEHLQGKLNGHEALRQTANRFYRRSPTGLPYTAKSPLFFGNPYDNLHCGWNLDGLEAGYRSAGCMVVAGWPHCPRHEKPVPNRGAWKIYHDLLYKAAQKTFPLLLLPADEARAALSGLMVSDPDGKAAGRTDGPRLVYGSRGEAVKALQRKLAARKVYKGSVDGDLGPRTYRAWNASGFIKA